MTCWSERPFVFTMPAVNGHAHIYNHLYNHILVTTWHIYIYKYTPLNSRIDFLKPQESKWSILGSQKLPMVRSGFWTRHRNSVMNQPGCNGNGLKFFFSPSAGTFGHWEVSTWVLTAPSNLSWNNHLKIFWMIFVGLMVPSYYHGLPGLEEWWSLLPSAISFNCFKHSSLI